MTLVYPTSLGQGSLIGRRSSFPILGAGSSAPVATYAEILRDTYGASEIWPLVDISSGTTIAAFINSARNGTLTGWGLQDAAGPVSGTLAPRSGSGDWGDLYSSGGGVGLADIFNGQTFSFIMWLTNDNWTGTDIRRPIDVRADGSNLFTISRLSGATMRLTFRSGGLTKNLDFVTASPSGWFSYGFSMHQGNDELKLYMNGTQQGATVNSLGTWAGVPSSTQTTVGSTSVSRPDQVWLGLMAYYAFIFGSIWSPADFSGIHAAAGAALPD